MHQDTDCNVYGIESLAVSAEPHHVTISQSHLYPSLFIMIFRQRYNLSLSIQPGDHNSQEAN